LHNEEERRMRAQPALDRVDGTPRGAEAPAGVRPPLTLSIKVLFGLGAMNSAAKAQLFGLLLLFYNQLIGMDARLVSLAISVSILIDAFWDPIFGQITDGTSTRWGRRHPYIYAAAVPAAICFALLFMPPNWPEQSLFVYLLLTVVAVRIFDSVQDISSSALMPELTHGYDERTTLQSYRYLFGSVLGGAVTAVLGFGVFLRSTKAQPYGQLNVSGYAPYAIAIAIVGLVSVLASAAATQRFVPYLHRPARRRFNAGRAMREIGAALLDRNFVALAISALVFGVSVGISGGLTSYFYTYFWELPSSALLQLRLWALPAGLLGVFLGPLAAKAWGKKPACLGIFFVAIFTSTLPVAARLAGMMPPNGSPWIVPILAADTMASSAMAVMGFVIVTSMIADVVEEIQVKTGRRSEGLLFAVESLLRKLSTSFSALLPGLVIALVRFPRHALPGHVDAAVLRNLGLIYLPTSVLLGLCSTGVLFLYRIDRTRHEQNLQRLADAAAMLEATGSDIRLGVESGADL
jgi:Na+/melibiose symporter-like transporter